MREVMQAAPPGILIFLRFPIAPDPVESQVRDAACPISMG